MSECPIAYRIPDAAKLTGTSRSTLYRLIAEKRITPRKVRGRVLIMREDLEALLRGQRDGEAA